MRFSPPSFRRSSLAGLSLIEVVLAIGILSFAIIPLIGLLAIGSSGYRAAMDQTVEAAIIQNVRTMSAQLASNVTTLPVSYYRDDGTLTTSSDSRVLYYVTNNILTSTSFYNSTNGTNGLSLMVDQYTIIHMPSGRTNAFGVIHVYPRPQ